MTEVHKLVGNNKDILFAFKKSPWRYSKFFSNDINIKVLRYFFLMFAFLVKKLLYFFLWYQIIQNVQNKVNLILTRDRGKSSPFFKVKIWIIKTYRTVFLHLMLNSMMYPQRLWCNILKKMVYLYCQKMTKVRVK